MSKTVFDNQNGKNLVTLNNNVNPVMFMAANGPAGVTLHGTIGDFVNMIPVSLSIITGSEIEVQNNNHLTVTDNTSYLSKIIATSGTIDLHNSYVYVGSQSTDITVGSGSTVNITGTNNDICIGTLTLSFNSTFNFTLNNHNYHIQTPNEIDFIGDNAMVQFQDIEKCITICEFINDKLTTNTPFLLEEVCYLRDYQTLNHTLVKLLTEQNGMVSINTINNFIDHNYFELAGIAHDNNLTGSFLEGAGPYNLMGEIASWLNLSDVDLTTPDDLDLLLGNPNLDNCLFE